MLNYRVMSLFVCVLLLFACAAVAESTPVAPEVVAGKIMGYVINSEGAKVYHDVFTADATHETEDTIEYGKEVDIKTLGLGYCQLRTEDDQLLYVRTRDLSFSNEPFDGQLAIVFLKRSNKLPLHKTASANSKRITDVPDGSYVVVLEKGDSFSRVLYGKYEGYLQNSYLSFRIAWQDDVTQAVLRDPKNPKRKTSINLRSADTMNGKKVAVVPTWDKKAKTNTILTVLQIKGDWAEVETAKGIHGYMKADWLEMQEALEPAVEDAELEEGVAMEETAVVDDEPEAVEADPAEDTELAPEWEEDQGA